MFDSKTNIILFLVISIILISISLFNFAKYKKLLRYSEVPQNLRKIYESAVDYGETKHVDPLTGKTYSHRFPVSQNITPSVKCCNGSKPQKCIPGGKGATGYSPNEWKSDTWKVLKFKIIDPHFYRYGFINSSDSKQKSFKAIAVGDIDCDGIESSFWRGGYLKNGRVIGSSEIFEKNPNE